MLFSVDIKSDPTPAGAYSGCSSPPFQGREPVGGNATHGQCNARPTITFPDCAGTKLILLGDRGTSLCVCVCVCVNDSSKVAPDSKAAGSRTRDLLIASPAP